MTLAFDIRMIVDVAHRVFDAQEQEIAEMVSWLEGEGANE